MTTRLLNLVRPLVALCGLLLAMTPVSAQSPPVLKWSELAPLPDPVGLAGPFVGVAGDALLAGGGANFPDKAPWQGGSKVWHDSVFVLTAPDADWQTGFKLPRPAAYGVTVSTRDGMICMGGGDARRHFRDVLLLQWNGRELTQQELPSLPKPLAFMAGVLHQNVAYIAGGMETPDSAEASSEFFALDLNPATKTPAWKSLPSCPGAGRILAQAASLPDQVLIAGGAKLIRDANGQVTREFLTDAWLFDPESQSWQAAARLPRSIVAAPNPGIPVPGGAAFLSGDDGRFFGQTLEFGHPGFPNDVFAFNLAANEWSRLSPFPKSVPSDTGPRHNAGLWPPVTTGGVLWRNRFVIASGEIRPGIRSPKVMAVSVEPGQP